MDLRCAPKLGASSAIGVNYRQAPVAEEMEWQTKGLCSSGIYDPELWSPSGKFSEQVSEKAKDICFDCPVMLQCGQWALEKHEVFGVWGGYSEGDREAIWTGRKRKRRYHQRVHEQLTG